MTDDSECKIFSSLSNTVLLGHTSVPPTGIFYLFNTFCRVHECDRRSDYAIGLQKIKIIAGIAIKTML